MQRSRTFVPVALTLGSVAAVCAAFATSPATATIAGDEAPSSVPPVEVRATTVAMTAAPENEPRAGATYVAVSATLASQLAIDPQGASVVTGVAEGTRAAKAGLQEHDVITEVEGSPASVDLLDAALESGERVELTLVRSGSPNVVVVPEEGAAPSRFSMTDALPADHPVVRVRELQRLQDNLQSRSDDVQKQRKEIAQSLRDTREEARAAAEALHGECVEEARRVLDEKRAALYEIVDTTLSAASIEPLAALRVNLEALVPGQRVAELDEAIHELAHALEDGMGERVEGLSSDRGLDRVGSAISARIHERVQEAWTELRSKHASYAERLGEDHDERMAWAAERIEGIRSELHERIDCAVERTLESFSKNLGSRLRDLDVPRSAELDASIADLCAQLDAYTHGFVAGTTDALEVYRAQVQPARTELVESLPQRFEEAASSWAELQKSVDAACAERFVAPEEGAPKWRRTATEREFLRQLRARLEAAVHEGRDALRPDANGLRRELRDEKERSDEAWSDLREALQSLHSRAASDCWKLDGPHLDGRFAPKLKEKFVQAEEGEAASAG